MIDIQEMLDSASDTACLICHASRNLAKHDGRAVKVQGKALWLCAHDAPAFVLARALGQTELNQKVTQKILSIPADLTGAALIRNVIDLIPARHRHVFMQSLQVGVIPEQSPRDIYRVISQSVIGQETAKEIVSIAVYNHVRSCSLANRDAHENNNLILIGPSGSGKTLMAQTVARTMGVPHVTADATKYTPTGFLGQDTDQIIHELFQAAQGSTEMAERGVVFLDEVDKLASTNSESRTEMLHSATQATLLRMVEGSQVRLSAPLMMGEPLVLNTTHMFWMLGGAFPGLEDIVAKKMGLQQGRIRRLGREEVEDRLDASLRAHNILSQASQDVLQASLQEYGLLAELIGRVPVVAALAPLTEAELMHVLLCAAHSPLRREQRRFADSEYALEFDGEALEALVKKARKMATGTRALTTLVKNAVSKAAFQLLDTAQNVRATSTGSLRGTVQIVSQTLEDPACFNLIKKRRSVKKQPSSALPMGPRVQLAVEG